MSFYSSSRPSSPPPTSQPLPPQKPVPDHATFSARQQKHIPPGIPVPVVAGSHGKTVRALAWSCNGTNVASGSDDRNVKIWTRPEPLLPHPTIVTPKPTTTSTNPITNLSFSPRRVDILAVASNDLSAGAPGGKVVAVQGPASEEYDKAAEETWGKEMAEGMKNRGQKAEPPKVEIWNLAKRQIITTIYLAHNPVFLAFHPSSKQLAIVCFDSRERNDYVVFAWQPRAVEEETDLVFEDEDISVEKAKREKEREIYRALLARQTQAAAVDEAAGKSATASGNVPSTSGLKDEGWQIRTDIRLGEKNYRVSELNGAMFGPCGTRLYAGNHDGRLNVWEYPIKRVIKSTAETLSNDDASGKKEEGDVEMEDGNDAQLEKTDEGDDDEDAPIRRSNENAATDEKRQDTLDESETDNAQPTANEGDAEVKTETPKGEEDEGETANTDDTASKVGEKEDSEMNAEPSSADKEGTTLDAEGDVEMEPVKDEQAKVDNSEAAPTQESQVTQPDTNATIVSENAVVPAASAAPVTAPAPVPEAQMLKWLFGQVVNSGCLNCIDIDPRRRYIATGGSEGMVNLCDFKEWITVASFDSYTEEVKSVKFSWDGEYIAAAGDDRCIDIMSTATGTTLHRIPTKGTVASLAWSPARHTLCYAVQGQGASTEWFYVQM